MKKAKVGDTVQVTYTAKLRDGTVFDESEKGSPLELLLGDYTVLPAFEDAIVGLGEGESTETVVSPSDAYGEYREELLAEMPRSDLPEDAKVEVGTMLQLGLSTGDQLTVTVIEIRDKSVIVDGNHPLAGKELHYEIRLSKITECGEAAE